MLIRILTDLLWFSLSIVGLALPVWPWLKSFQGAERLALAVASALLITYLAVFSLYIADVPLRWFWLLPVAGLIHGIVRPAAILAGWRDPAVRALLGRWLLLSLWCLGLHGLVVSYSGAAWAGDWLEHYDRAHFFLQRWPANFLFLDVYPLPARPPLVNLWTAGMLAQTGGGFAHYQVLTTLLGTLVIFPLSVLLNRWRNDRRSEYLLLILLMACPLFIQNATFPWTKLGAAFFILLAITQFSPSAGGPTRARLITGAVLLAAGLLAHYSAGPWICAAGAAGLWLHRHLWSNSSFRHSVLLAVLAACLVCVTWFAWSMAVYGSATTFTANTAVGMAPSGTLAERALRAAKNLWFTVTPVPTGTTAPLFQQANPIGHWRDYWFLLYQLRLPFAFGLAGGPVILWLLLRLKWSLEVNYWLIVVPLAVFLGTATHAQPDLFGLTHISLQPLVLLGLVWLAAQSDRLPRWLRWSWVCGLILDLTLGILLHFSVQSFWIDRWLQPGLDTKQYVATYTAAARVNWNNKSLLKLTYLADIVPPVVCLLMMLTAVAITMTFLVRAAKRAPASAISQ